MITDYIVVVSSLEYVYEGKTKWPRAGCTAAFFALQGVGVLGGTLLALALSKGAQVSTHTHAYTYSHTNDIHRLHTTYSF